MLRPKGARSGLTALSHGPLAQANPVHAASLLGLFPLAQHHRGCVGLALSLDGIRWSRVTPLLECAVHGARAEAQPVGLVLLPESRQVAVFVHERVPGIAYDEKTPYRLAKTLRQLEMRHGGGQVVRYTLPCEALAEWTREQLAGLDAPAPRTVAARRSRSSYVCSPARRCGA